MVCDGFKLLMMRYTKFNTTIHRQLSGYPLSDLRKPGLYKEIIINYNNYNSNNNNKGKDHPRTGHEGP
jgi:hypothetical protein